MRDFGVSILRFPNVVGRGATHGVILDFIRKLQRDPRSLAILGDGTQCKPYLHISDLISAIELVMTQSDRLVSLNVAGLGRTTVRRIADMVCEKMGLAEVSYQFTGGNVGWKGDVPEFEYDIARIRALGWAPSLDSDQAVRRAVGEILEERS
jgi:UDP-glucose 4-epimerase